MWMVKLHKLLRLVLLLTAILISWTFVKDLTFEKKAIYNQNKETHIAFVETNTNRKPATNEEINSSNTPPIIVEDITSNSIPQVSFEEISTNNTPSIIVKNLITDNSKPQVSVEEINTNNTPSIIVKNMITDNSKPQVSVEEFKTNNTPPISVGTNATSQSISVASTSKLKYILQWTSHTDIPLAYLGNGQQGFIDRKCPHVNCFVTADRNYLGDVTKFDAIVFAPPALLNMSNDQLPQKRSPHQKYAFASTESADYYPICSNRLDGYFNWTWSYRLDSDLRWGYITIRDVNKNVIGPNKIMHWMKLADMDPVSNEFKNQLKSKTIAAAWFVSNCFPKRKRDLYIFKLQLELARYGLVLDIYGGCGPLKCSKKDGSCDRMIREKYYFYMAFENSFDEDYVTEKLARALQFDAVPIVFGGANYTRFMPDGIYLHARELGVKDLAIKMSELIQNPDKYADCFRWKNHYSYEAHSERIETDDYCMFCDILNDAEKVKKKTVYENLRRWWDPLDSC